jgi:hypothetical protein
MIVVRGGALPAALEPAEGGVPRTQMFHPAALSRSNISLELTLARLVVIMHRRAALRAIQFGR